MKILLALMGLFLCLDVFADGTVMLAKPDGTAYGVLNNGLPVSLSSLLSGEDQTNSVMKVEQQYSKCYATADTVCKATVPAFVHSVWCYGVDAAATAGRVRLVDDATVTGTAANEIWGAEFAAAIQPPIGQVIDQVMIRGIEFDFTTTADVTCVASYR